MTVIETINRVIIGIMSVAFLFQIVYLLLFFLRPERFPAAKEKKRIAVIVCAHNEEARIGACIRAIMLQKYPRDRFSVFVVADRCTDGTAVEAEKAGATVIVRPDEGKSRRGAGYAMQFGVSRILAECPDTDFFIRFDADDLPLPDYLDKMNDAFSAGAELARGYNHASNLTENVIAGVSGLWYIRDCRFNCNARSTLRVGEMLVGGGMAFSARLVKDGWTAVGYSEDAEFTAERLLCGYVKAHYVSEAVVYEDQPATLRALLRRNARMGRGLNKLFFTHGLKCLLKFFTTLRYTYLDFFLSLLFVPIALVSCVWFPAYYITIFVVYRGTERIARELVTLAAILVFAFILPFILQAALAAVLERRKIGIKARKLLPAVLAFPLFMIVYAVGIAYGTVARPAWKQIERSKYYDAEFIERFESASGTSFDEVLHGKESAECAKIRPTT